MNLLSFSEYNKMKLYEETQELLEKLIVFSGGKKYGQIVMMSGGAAAGKGFARTNFLDAGSYKVRDVDELKLAVLELDRIKGKYPEIRGLNLKTPDDVFKLHMFVKEKGFSDKSLNLLLTDLKSDRLPNILFDITGKSLEDFHEIVPRLLDLGYESKNIHLCWVLTNYALAVANNAGRERVVPDDIMLKTHTGSAKTMEKIVSSGHMPYGIDGRFVVILNNRDETVSVGSNTTDSIMKKKSKKDGKVVWVNIDKTVVRDFKYLEIKKSGEKINLEDSLKENLYRWIKDNVPKTSELSHLLQ